jgi:hypothetical protein
LMIETNLATLRSGTTLPIAWRSPEERAVLTQKPAKPHREMGIILYSGNL